MPSEGAKQFAPSSVLNDSLEVVVAQLDRDIAAYLRMGVSSRLYLNVGQLQTAIHWAISVNRGGEIDFVENTPEDFFLSGLLEEIKQVPGSIFEKVVNAEGRERLLPITQDRWEQALIRYATHLQGILDKGVITTETRLEASFFSESIPSAKG